MAFAPKPSPPKFVDPQDVDFAIKDLLKGRHIGAYQDLTTPGGEQFLSRSRVHTPPGKEGQAAHRACPLQPQRVNGQASNNLRGSSHTQVCGQAPRLYAQLGCGKSMHTFMSRSTPSIENSFRRIWRCRSVSTTSFRLLRLHQTRPRAIGALGSNAAASAPPLSSSRRVLACGLAALVDELAKNLNERHVRSSSSDPLPRHAHAAVCR